LRRGRLRIAFSRKVENDAAAIALHTMYYDFVRVHETLRVTPAMAAGVSQKLREEKCRIFVELLEQWELANSSRNINSSSASPQSGRGILQASCGAAGKSIRFSDLRKKLTRWIGLGEVAGMAARQGCRLRQPTLGG
jgi:hypothetical protein